MRIIISVNEPDSRRFLASTLTEWGYEAVVANSVENRQPPQGSGAELFIVDSLSGLDSVAGIRRRCADAALVQPYIIVLIDRKGRRNIAETLEAEANDYITGPIDRDELMGRIKVGERMVCLESELGRYVQELKEHQGKLLVYSDELEKKIAERTEQLESINNRLQAELSWRERAEDDLAKFTRVLKVVTACNEAMVYSEDEEHLLSNICGLIVDIGDYRFAWVGYADQTRNRNVTPIAQAGIGDDYLESIKISWADTDLWGDPVGIAISTGKQCVVKDIAYYPDHVTWRNDAIRHGFASLAAFPLTDSGNGQTFGALVFCTDMTDSFDEEETNLLRELVNDLAFGICALRDRSERRRVEEQIHASLKEKEVLLKEIHHRVKNNMQIVSSLLNLQSRLLKDKQAITIFQESRNRIESMALIHDKLYRSKDLSRIDFKDYIYDLTSNLLLSYGVDSSRIRRNLNVAEVALDVDTAIPVGMILNELVSNSLKHAFPAGKSGEIRIDLGAKVNGRYTLIVADDGEGFPEDLDFRNSESLGLKLVSGLVEQLDGAIELNKSRGTQFKITFGESLQELEGVGE